MFSDAIEKVSSFTRALHSIIRTFSGGQIIPASSTLFFINEEGYALTCKHVADLMASSEGINMHYRHYIQERKTRASLGQADHELNNKYGYSEASIIQIKNNFVDCFDSIEELSFINHPTLDLSVIKFKGVKNPRYRNFARFKKNPTGIRQGDFLCRLGFPFPEFNNFTYNTATDDIEWTRTGNVLSPIFPIEGMITRFLADNNGLYGIELSTPGLRGQSGGPLFDQKGIIYGLQYSTKHMHLGFDLENTEIMVNNISRTVSDYSFLHLGQCIHVSAITSFLRQHKIPFYEED